MRLSYISHALGVVGLLTLSSTGMAQGTAESPKDCAKAASTFDKGHPTRKKYDEAWQTLRSCPHELSEFYVDRLREMRRSTDVVNLEQWSQEASGLRDGAIFDATIAMTSDLSAGPEARAMALVTAERILSPSGFSPYTAAVASLQADPSGNARKCTRVSLSDFGQISGSRPLAADAGAQRDALVRKLLADSTTPPLLRAVATCS